MTLARLLAITPLTDITTWLRTLTGDVVTISNGLIVQITNLSRDWARAVVDVPPPLGVDVPPGQRPAPQGRR
jgi:small conductance mechanosensitive channel